MASDRDKDMLDYAKKAAPHGNIPRWVPPGYYNLPVAPPSSGTRPNFKKGGKVHNYCKGGKVISTKRM